MVGARLVALTDALNEEQGNEETAELRKALIQTQKQLAKAKLRNEELVTATHRGAYEAMLALGKVQPVPVPKKDARKAKAEVALIHSTDWQGSKVTSSYNSKCATPNTRKVK